MHELAEWDSFYVIIGSAAGGLIGLQFVVITLLAEKVPPKAAEANAAFSTPTIIHFGAVLFLAAMLRAPWPTLWGPVVVGTVAGLLGVIYELITVKRMRSQKAYDPVFEDWLFHAWLPIVAYLTLIASALLTYSHSKYSLFGIGAAALLLLFIGIHNAWDAASYHVTVVRFKNFDDDK